MKSKTVFRIIAGALILIGFLWVMNQFFQSPAWEFYKKRNFTTPEPTPTLYKPTPHYSPLGTPSPTLPPIPDLEREIERNKR